MNRNSVIVSLVIFTALFAARSEATVVKPSVGVKVVLHDTATVMGDDNGFFTLGEISDITGGTPELRDKLNNVEVGRAPMDSYVRHLDLGDVALKLRQAGVDPYRDLKLSGAENIVVSIATRPVTVRTVSTNAGIASSTTQSSQPAPEIAIKRGDPITIVLQEGVLTVTATGQSRDNGAVGDVIHVHRNGVNSDIMAQVLDNHTVQMEM